MKPTRKRATRLLAFGPALVMVCVTAYVASGASLVSGATAASTVGVAGTVGVLGSGDPDPGSDCDDGDGYKGFPADWRSNAQVTTGCTVEFYTNNGLGTAVMFEDANGSATNFFCGDADPTPGYQSGTRDCDTDSNALDNVAPNSAVGNNSDTFGIGLTAIGGGGSPTFGTGVEAAQPASAATAMWYPINNTQRQLCRSTAPNTSATTATCTFAFAAAGEGATQGAGDYLGTMNLVLQPN